MRYYVGFPLLVAIAWIQTSVLSPLPILAVRPDLMLLAVIGWGMMRGAKEALIWGIVGGVLLDLLGGGPLGISVLALLPIAIVSGVGETKLMESNLNLALALALLGSVLYNGIYLLLLQLLGNHVEWWLSFLRLFLPCALLNTLLMPFAYGLFRWLGGRARSVRGVEVP